MGLWDASRSSRLEDWAQQVSIKQQGNVILDIPIPSDTNIFQRDNGEGIKVLIFNPLAANFTKWSNTLKQFVGKLTTNCLIAFDHFVGLALKGLRQEIQRIWINAEVAPIIIGAFGTTTKKLWKTDEGTRYPCFNPVFAGDNSTWYLFFILKKSLDISRGRRDLSAKR